MFTLRRITSQNLESNTYLGESYNLIDSEKNPEDYKKTLKIMKWDADPDVYGFIIHDSGSKIIPLYKKSTYFIMCSNGRTYANITYK